MQLKPHECSVTDVKQRLDANETFVLLDVRENDEWAQGHLPHAVHLPRGLVEQQFQDKFPDRETAVVAYCARGGRSLLAVTTLINMGYNNVSSMAGGIVQWAEQGFPIAK